MTEVDMLGFYAPANISDAEKAERASNLSILVCVLLIVVTVALVAISFAQPALTPRIVQTFSEVAGLTLVVLILNRHNWTTLASWLFVAAAIFIVTNNSLSAGGIRSPGVSMFYVFALAAGLLLGLRAGIATALACAGIGFALVLSERNHLLPPETVHYGAFAYWWLNVLYMGLVIFLLHLATRSIRRAFHRAETELAARSNAERRLQTLVDEATVGILVYQDFKPVAANRALARMLGYDSGNDILGISDVRQLFADGQWEKVKDQYYARQRGLGGPGYIELRCKTNDGGEIDIESRGFPILWDGRMSVCAMVTDVTEQRALEAQLRQSQRLEAVGQMTGGIAHDFNNLLTIILGNARVLEGHLKEDEHLRDMAELIRMAAERGAKLTRRLVAFSREQALDIRAADINEIVVGLRGLIQQTLGAHIGIEITCAPELCHASVDTLQLENSLLNIAVNARDAMPNGGRLTIRTRNVVMDEAPENDAEYPEAIRGEYVLISVSDTGEGMDEQTLQHAFEPYFTTKDFGKGSGLGLSMVYGFVRQLNGHVRLKSKPGQGTTIELYLPRAQRLELRLETSAVAPAITRGSEKILVVEDDDLLRKQVATQLSTLGYQVSVASCGDEALHLLAGGPDFELLFTDVMLPDGMNGYELAAAAQKLRPKLPILFTSGYVEKGICGRELDPDLLRKPYEIEELAVKLRSVLQPWRNASVSPRGSNTVLRK